MSIPALLEAWLYQLAINTQICQSLPNLKSIPRWFNLQHKSFRKCLRPNSMILAVRNKKEKKLWNFFILSVSKLVNNIRSGSLSKFLQTNMFTYIFIYMLCVSPRKDSRRSDSFPLSHWSVTTTSWYKTQPFGKSTKYLYLVYLTN